MVSLGRALGIAAQDTPTSTNGQSIGAANGPIDQLRALLEKGRTPTYIKLMVELLVQTRSEIKTANERNATLIEEIRSLREEDAFLRNKLANIESERGNGTLHQTEVKASPSVSEDKDMARSIVLLNVPELPNSSPTERLAHDYSYVEQLLEFLGVECKVSTVYRMGKLDGDRPRLIKVELPASRFRKQAVRRAPRLRFFTSQKGIFLRPSLPLEERNRIREQRLAARRAAVEGSTTANHAEGDPQSQTTPVRYPSSSPLQHNSPPGNC